MFALTKKLVLSSLAGLGLLMSLSTGAHAAQETFVYSGTTCEGNTPADAAKLIFNGYGVLNGSSTTATIICPMPTRPAQFVAAVVIQGYDRSPSNINCELEYMDSAGNSFISQQNRGTSVNQIAPTGFNFTLTPSSAYGMTMLCTIPPSTASGVSGITEMRVTTNIP